MVDLRRRVVAFRLLAVKPGRDIGQVFKIQVQRSYVMCKSVGIMFQNWDLQGGFFNWASPAPLNLLSVGR